MGLGQLEAARATYELSRGLFEAIHLKAMAMEAVAGLARVALARGDAAQARTEVQTLLDYRASGGTFEGTEEPLRIALTCWQVMSAANDARASGLLADAHADLQAQVAHIADARLRHSLLCAVPHHRAIEQAWAAQAASAV
jgi:hypothetical protein